MKQSGHRGSLDGQSLGRVALWSATAVAVWFGWRVFWFLTDDAFIAFRYASNAVAGIGLTWNPPPFTPVEGYTSFLWVKILEWIWRLTDLEPPAVANGLSLLFGYATLWVGSRTLYRMKLPDPLSRYRTWLLALVLLGTISNRTFLAWLSSGLETSLFNFLLISWVHFGLTPADERSSHWRWLFSATTALAALARPDGLLLCAAWVAITTLEWMRTSGRLGNPSAASPRRHPRDAARNWLHALPMAIVPIHFAWRFATYHAWLPNTYYAKHLGAWPQSGWRYLASFIVEYGLAVWIVLALAVLARWALRAPQSLSGAHLRNGLIERGTGWITIGTLAVHALYYTFAIGGDHFEYRVYSHLILLSLLSLPWLAGRLSPRPHLAVGSLLLLIAMSWPIPWTHWWHTRHLETRDDTFKLALAVSPLLPAPFSWIAGPWDEWQAWLVSHSVCRRHQEHKIFYESQKEWYPSREVGARIPWEYRRVVAVKTVGVPGWVFPNVAVLDELGLNDRVIAHSAPAHPDHRLMAHDRKAPEGYIACFGPNFTVNKGQIHLMDEIPPLTDERITACESRFWNSILQRKR
jgi:arabinofuranosyltransferase